MTFEIICDSCNSLIYAGYDLRYVREVLKPNAGKCKNCGCKLSQNDFAIAIVKVGS
ncbi:MAG TPA: hypothetical protein VIH03_08890 [Nitrososphaerales archaeon]